jgi:hypothetical protein
MQDGSCVPRFLAALAHSSFIKIYTFSHLPNPPKCILLLLLQQQRYDIKRLNHHPSHLHHFGYWHQTANGRCGWVGPMAQFFPSVIVAHKSSRNTANGWPRLSRMNFTRLVQHAAAATIVVPTFEPGCSNRPAVSTYLLQMTLWTRPGRYERASRHVAIFRPLGRLSLFLFMDVRITARTARTAVVPRARTVPKNEGKGLFTSLNRGTRRMLLRRGTVTNRRVGIASVRLFLSRPGLWRQGRRWWWWWWWWWW